jgi:O-succinylbenzoate synthase
VLGRTLIGVEGLEEAVETNRARGVDHLILHLSGSIWSSYGLDQLDRAAEVLF